MLSALSGITKLSSGKTRIFSGENVYGTEGKGGTISFNAPPPEDVLKIGQKFDGPNPASRDLGQKWKVRPCITLEAGKETVLADTSGPGYITHIWITMDVKFHRDIILRMYWDGEEYPSVEAPVGDFFCNGWLKPLEILSIPINVNPKGGLNCYFPMPFRKHAKITVENRLNTDLGAFFYAISMREEEVGPDEAYFHAKFRRTNPLQYMDDYVIIDGIKGHGHYVGTHMCWQQNSNGWWGEGEFKAFIDGDGEFPTYIGTGTEDYFGGAWCFEKNYSAPFLGYQDVSTLPPENRKMGENGNRHSMYRFHIMDPIIFKESFRCTMQALGWRSEGRYLPLQDDISSVAYWYQTEPHAKFEALANRDYLEII